MWHRLDLWFYWKWRRYFDAYSIYTTSWVQFKVAVGTSTMIMTLIALTGAISHISMGAILQPIPMLLVTIFCLIGAYVSAKFAYKCEIKKLNRIVGTCLGILGIVTILIKLI